jgi:biopolymer transport protein ExbB/TolQ
MESIIQAFRDGGEFMYPILVVSVFVVGVVLERGVWLYIRAAVDKRVLMTSLCKLVRAREIGRAIKLTQKTSSPIAPVLLAGLVNIKERKEVVQLLMDEAALVEIPNVESRTGYLAMLSNVATLTGLLGTIVGLIRSFGAVANADASEKSEKLAAGISEAMNCTAFGLIVAIPALLMYAVLMARTHKVVDDINLSAVQLYNVITEVKRECGEP